MFTQLLYRDVLAHLHASSDIHADFAHDVDFGLDDGLVELVRRNAILQHTTRNFVLLEHRGLITHGGEVVGAAQTRRTTADDGNLLLPALKNT